MKENRTKEVLLKKNSLITKLAAIVGIAILVGLVIMNTITIKLSTSAITSKTDQEMLGYSQSNSNRIGGTIKATSVMYYTIENAFYLMDNEAEGSHTSEVNGEELTQAQYDVEKVILNQLDMCASTYSNVISANVMMLPGKFTEKNYAPSIAYNEDKTERTLTNLDYNAYADTGYYKKAINGELMGFSTPTTVDGQKTLPGCFPITVNEEIIGVFIVYFQSDFYDSLYQKSDDYPNMTLDVINQDGTIMYATNKDVIGHAFKDEVTDNAFDDVSKKWKKTEEQYKLELTTKSGDLVSFGAPMTVGSNVWWIQLNVPKDEYMESANKIKWSIISISGAIILILILLTVYVISNTLKPLWHIKDASDKVAMGNFDIDLSYDKQDEIGIMIQAIQGVVDRMQLIIRDLTEKLTEIAHGNFDVDLSNTEDYVGEYSPILGSLNEITTDLNETVVNIRNAANQVRQGAAQVASASQTLAQGTAEQASSVEELSATMGDMEQKVYATADRAKATRAISEAAAESIQLSNQKMDEMNAAMDDIVLKSSEISKIIKTIDDIAFQTNLLSLNASIEAARAGAAGKGFAVVADEVGNLAKKCQAAAKNTAELIEDTIKSVERGGAITKETVESMVSVYNNSNEITALVAEISETTDLQANEIRQVTAGIDQISSVVQNNSATAEESAAASEQLSSQAKHTDDLVEKFNLKRN